MKKLLADILKVMIITGLHGQMLTVVAVVPLLIRQAGFFYLNLLFNNIDYSLFMD